MLQQPTYTHWHLTCNLCCSSVLRLFITGAQTWYMQMLHSSDISSGIQQRQDSKIRAMSIRKTVFNDICRSIFIYFYFINTKFCVISDICYIAYTENILRTVVARSRVTVWTTSYVNRVNVVLFLFSVYVIYILWQLRQITWTHLMVLRRTPTPLTGFYWSVTSTSIFGA